MTFEAARLLSVPSSRWFQLGHRGVWHAKLRRPGSWISAAIAQNCVAPMHSLGETGFVNEPGTVVAKQCVLQRFPDATVLREYSWGQLWPTGPSSPFRSATPNTRLER